DTHFYANFGHLGGYSSAYYTYQWSLVIAKDLFSAFKHDDMFNAEIAGRYRDRILAPGGSKPAAELVSDFLGRPFSFDAYAEWLSRWAAGAGVSRAATCRSRPARRPAGPTCPASAPSARRV